MNITQEHLASAPKRIGHIDGRAVNEIVTTGGFHIVATHDKDGKLEILGTGPHRAVSRAIAKKREPKMQITELSKADYIEPQFFEDILPQYEQATDLLRERLLKKQG